MNPVERFTAGQCLEHEWVRRAGEASAKKLHRRPPPPAHSSPPPLNPQQGPAPRPHRVPAGPLCGKGCALSAFTERFDGRRAFDNGVWGGAGCE